MTHSSDSEKEAFSGDEKNTKNTRDSSPTADKADKIVDGEKKKDDENDILVEHRSADEHNHSARTQFDAQDLDRVQRHMNQRHVQMIAIAGTIGTGLFLGSGKALGRAGPLGALIAYLLVGTVAYSTLCSVGEMTTWAPISGSFPHFATRWVDPAMGFAVGWNYFYNNAISVPVEVTASVILITYWDKDQNHIAIYTAVLAVLMCAINLFGARWFGESEFFFAIIKISTITGLLIAGLVIDLGGGPSGDRIGFRYWKDPGAINRAGLVENLHTDRFLAILAVLVQAAFSFQGMELVAVAASEVKNPRRNIAKAVHRVFYRIVIFYILGILMIGMLVPYTDSGLLSDTGTAASSPFVIAIERAGISALPHVINGAVFTSAFSAGNSFLFCASRILYGLALRGQAPKIFTRCTRGGLPIYAVVASGLFGFLAFMNVSAGSERVFGWFVSLSTVGGFFGWLSINVTYIYFYHGMKAQKIDRTSNIYYNSWQPWISYWGAFWNVFFILTSGYAVFFEWNASDFVVSYINIPLFIALFVGWKWWHKTCMWKPAEMDFVTGIPPVSETEGPEVKPTTVLGKIGAAVF